MRLEHLEVPTDSLKQFAFKKTNFGLLVKMILYFIKPKFREIMPGFGEKYKVFNGKEYILDRYILPPDHWNCRCEIKGKEIDVEPMIYESK